MENSKNIEDFKNTINQPNHIHTITILHQMQSIQGIQVLWCIHLDGLYIHLFAHVYTYAIYIYIHNYIYI
jgi:hypothetical protein